MQKQYFFNRHTCKNTPTESVISLLFAHAFCNLNPQRMFTPYMNLNYICKHVNKVDKKTDPPVIYFGMLS